MSLGKLKIAVMGILAQKISVDALGGTEIFTAELVNELTKRGHEVTLFGSSDSDVNAKISGDLKSSFFSEKINFSVLVRRVITFQIDMFIDFLKIQKDYDFLHISVAEYYSLLPLLKFLEIPYCITVHNKIMENEDLELLSRKFSNVNLVFSQNSQKNTSLWKNSTEAIWHGVDVESFTFNESPKKYLSWIGRLVKGKGLDNFSRIQEETQEEIIFGGSDADSDYFKNEITRQIQHNDKIKFAGQLNHEQKNNLLKDSYLFINPREMSSVGGLAGLVVLEANACGTPVLAYNSEAMREIIKDGINGYLVPMGDLQSFNRKIKDIYEMNNEEYKKLRHRTREYAENNFTIQKMVDKYEKLYSKIK